MARTKDKDEIVDRVAELCTPLSQAHFDLIHSNTDITLFGKHNLPN